MNPTPILFALPLRRLLQELGEGPWAQANLDPGSSLLVPVRGAAGAVVVGESYVAYLEGGTALRSAGLQPTLVKVRLVPCMPEPLPQR